MDLHKHHSNKGARGWVQPVHEVSVAVKLWKATSTAHPYPHSKGKQLYIACSFAEPLVARFNTKGAPRLSFQYILPKCKVNVPSVREIEDHRKRHA
jgi:hypothetical protein